MAGQVTVEPSVGDTTRVRVWNFDTSHTELKLPEHKNGLKDLVIPLIRVRRPIPFVHLIGMASRRGPFELNQRLSLGRVNSVREELIRLLRDENVPLPEQRLPSYVAMGELLALNAGRREFDNSGRDRAVLIEISQSPVPTINVRPTRPPIANERDTPTLTLQRYYKIAMLHEAGGGFSIGAGSEMSFLIWDPVQHMAARYRCLALGLGAAAGVVPGPPIGASLEGEFNPFTTRAPLRVDEFDFCMLSLLAGSVGGTGFLGGGGDGRTILGLDVPGETVTINPFVMGESIELPSAVSGRYIRGPLEQVGPAFRYYGPRRR